MPLKYFEQFEPIDDFRRWSLRNTFKKIYENIIEYDEFKLLLEKLLNSYSDVITQYTIDINKEIYISCDIEINKNDRLAAFYNDFIKLLKDNDYYVMGYRTDDGNGYKKDITIDLFKNNKYLRIFLDKIFDVPIELKGLQYLYHVTLKDLYKEKIIKSGLIPDKQEMVSHEPKGKVYLFKNIEDCYNFIRERHNYLKNNQINELNYFEYLKNYEYPYPNIYEKRNENNTELDLIIEKHDINSFVILKIDIQTIGDHFKIYKDKKETERDAYYTYDHIPHWSIILEKEFTY